MKKNTKVGAMLAIMVASLVMTACKNESKDLPRQVAKPTIDQKQDEKVEPKEVSNLDLAIRALEEVNREQVRLQDVKVKIDQVEHEIRVIRDVLDKDMSVPEGDDILIEYETLKAELEVLEKTGLEIEESIARKNKIYLALSEGLSETEKEDLAKRVASIQELVVVNMQKDAVLFVLEGVRKDIAALEEKIEEIQAKMADADADSTQMSVWEEEHSLLEKELKERTGRQAVLEGLLALFESEA